MTNLAPKTSLDLVLFSAELIKAKAKYIQRTMSDSLATSLHARMNISSITQVMVNYKREEKK